MIKRTNDGAELDQRMQQLNREYVAALQAVELLKQRIASLERADVMAQTLFARHEDDQIARKREEILGHRATLGQEFRRQSAHAADLMAQIAAVDEEITMQQMVFSQPPILTKTVPQPENVLG